MLHSTSSSAKALPRERVANGAHAGRPYGDCAIFIALPTLLNMTAVPDLHVSRTLISVFFLGMLLKNTFVYSAISKNWQHQVSRSFGDVFNGRNKSFILLLTLILLFTGSEVRGGYEGTVSAISYAGFFLWSTTILFYLASVAALNRNSVSRQWLWVSLVCGFGFYIAINIIGYLAGLRGPVEIEDAGPNKILSIVGVSALRVAFPFSGGLNNFGSMAALSIVSGFFLALYSRGAVRFLLGAAVALFGLVGAVLVDSRAALALALLCCATLPAIVSKEKPARSIKLLPVLAFAAPFLIFSTFVLIRDSGMAAYVMREGDFAQRLGVLSGRDVIWGSALTVLGDPSPIHLIGYGAFGQFTSGATQGYSWVFSQFGGMSQHSLHNANLQIVLDMGYMGLLCWMAFWMLLARDLYEEYLFKNKSIESVIPISLATFVMLAGVLEICGTPAFPDIFVIVMLLVVFLLPTLRIKVPVE